MYTLVNKYGYEGMPNYTEELKQHVSYLELDRYYNTQIKECFERKSEDDTDVKIVAIPVNIYNHGDSIAHANMMVVRKHPGNPEIIVELFEPYGSMSLMDNTYELTVLAVQLFSYDEDITSQDDIKIISATPPNCSIQGKVLGTLFKDSCAILTIWYAVNRLLYLEREPNPEDTFRRMENYLKTDPAGTIKRIVASFIVLLNINSEGVINGRKKMGKSTLSEVRNYANTLRGGRKRRHNRKKTLKKGLKNRRPKTHKQK